MIKVLVVDDSAVVRRVLADALSKAPDIEVVGTAIDPYSARDKIVALQPDVLTLDIEMPRMDGLTFLTKLMHHHPLPVVVISTLTEEGSETAIRALEIGAVAVACKPGSPESLAEVSAGLIDSIRTASKARLARRRPSTRRAGAQTRKLPTLDRANHSLVAIGASTGGTEAIKSVLEQLPPSTPGTLIVLHMPEQFTGAFARRLDSLCPMEVREARHLDRVMPGLALVAPGNRHMVLRRSGTNRFVEIKNGPRVHHQRPSVDVLFQSIARQAPEGSVGVLLTGMGADGASGLLAMREAGAHTLAQDEESCIVFGMPKEAIDMGAAEAVVTLEHVAGAIIGRLHEAERKADSIR